MRGTIDGIQGSLERLSRTWWVYVLLGLPFFAPSYAVLGYDPRRSSALVATVLRSPLISSASPLFPLLKLAPVILMAAILVFRNRVRSIFSAYIALLFLAIAAFQNSASTEEYGFVVITGNVILVAIVALSWLWETISRRGDYSRADPAPWKWPLFAIAFLAFWYPVNGATAAPDFHPVGLVANGSMVTYCMVTPVVLAFMLLYFPRVNLVTVRVSSFVGILFGVVNAITWFLLDPSMWWMGVLHIPLLLISSLCFVLSMRRQTSG